MDIYKEIRKIIEYQNSTLLKQERKTATTINSIIESVTNSYNSKSFNFSTFADIRLNQGEKKRNIKMYSNFSCEEILCIYLKRLLDRKFRIKYPNRNSFMHSLFDISNALRDMNDFTIYRFDFKNFFNSVSSMYVFKKYIKVSTLERYQIDLMEDFVNSTRYAYAGLNTSNIFCEIIAKHFDESLTLKLMDAGVIYYRRYIDDGIIIFNQFISSDYCSAIIEEAIQDVFYDTSIICKPRCRVKLNSEKEEHITKRELNFSNDQLEFNFLGYQFVMKNTPKGKTDFKYGISPNKIKKYTKKIDNLIRSYKSDKKADIVLLRHQIKAFSSRTVYRITKYKTVIFRTKGFISNYSELRYRTSSLTPETKTFLDNVIVDAFDNNGISLPYFMKAKQKESTYNLFNNMEKYRTLLFVEEIGISAPTLEKMCKQIGITVDGTKKYDGLVSDYLIKVKVGH